MLVKLFLRFYFRHVCVCVSAGMSVPRVHTVQILARSPENGVRVGYKPLCDSWELNTGPLKGLLSHLNNPLFFVFIVFIFYVHIRSQCQVFSTPSTLPKTGSPVSHCCVYQAS